MKLTSLFFLVPTAVLFGIGVWLVGNNIINYLQDIDEINNNTRFCNGMKCVCDNVGCFTQKDVESSYLGYLINSLIFIFVGVAILFIYYKRQYLKQYFM